MAEQPTSRSARILRNVNIRRVPTTEGNAPVGRYIAGTEITVHEVRQVNGDTWGRVEYQGEPAWVAKEWRGISFMVFTDTVDMPPAHDRARVLRNVNIRREPSTQGNVPVGSYRAGEEIDLKAIRRVNGDIWARVEYEGAPAWVAMEWRGIQFLEYIEKEPSLPPTPPPAEEIVPAPARVLYSVNVRRVPTTQDNVPVGSYRAGEEILIYELRLEDGNLWARVEYGGAPAWVAVEWRGFTFVIFTDPEAKARLRARLIRDIRKALLIETVARVYPKGSDEYTRFVDLVGAARDVDLDGFQDIAGEAMPEAYKHFWAMQERLGLPDPFTRMPPPLDAQRRVFFQGFGPNTFAMNNWHSWYRFTAGMHNGVDYAVPAGTALYALADGLVEDIAFLGNPNEVSLMIRCFMPERFNRDGRRVLSNVRLAYGHLTTGRGAGSWPISNLLVEPGDVVQAGQYIADAGYPISGSLPDLVHQVGNAHLHFEIHLVEHNGDTGHGTREPFNPLLFFTPEVVMQQIIIGDKNLAFPYPARQTLVSQGYGFFPSLDYWTIGSFRYGVTPVWQYPGTRTNPWPHGVFGLDQLVEELADWQVYQGGSI